MKKRTGQHVNHRIQQIASGMVSCILAVVFLSGFFLRANYSFEDYPYFTKQTGMQYLYVLLAACLLFVCMFVGNKLKRYVWAAYIVYALAAVLYVFVIGLEPFSDMKSIYEIATENLQDAQGYLSTYQNQIPVTVYLWLVVSLLGKSILTPKLVNIFCNLVIVFFVYKIFCLTNESEDETGIVWFALPNLAVLLYVNHIYSDIIFTTLATIMMYLILENRYTKTKTALLIALAVCQYMIRPSGIIYIIAMAMYMILYQREWKRCVCIVAVIVLSVTGISQINKRVFAVKEDASYPVWSFIQMGVNEEEFGFQDGTHSTEWTLEDCIEKYRELGLKKVLKIYAKKELWLWTEGTYQAQRYGYGDAAASYTSENKITEYLRMMEVSVVRSFSENFMKAQYWIYMSLALIGVIYNRKNERISLLLYVICGFFCFYLIWEIKSRYIYSLYPIFCLFAYRGYLVITKSRHENTDIFVA